MKFVTLCLVVVAAASGAVGLPAQGKPNLSGTWISVGPQEPIQELTIKQDDSTLSLESQPDGSKHTFNLDGSDTRMSGPDGKPLLAKAVWEGKTLVVTVNVVETKQDIRRVTWALDPDGQLVLETAFLGGKPEPPVKVVFKRR